MSVKLTATTRVEGSKKKKKKNLKESIEQVKT